jgi:molecular chaperone GrpE (heat shock protein)
VIHTKDQRPWWRRNGVSRAPTVARVAPTVLTLLVSLLSLYLGSRLQRNASLEQMRQQNIAEERRLAMQIGATERRAEREQQLAQVRAFSAACYRSWVTFLAATDAFETWVGYVSRGSPAAEDDFRTMTLKQFDVLLKELDETFVALRAESDLIGATVGVQIPRRPLVTFDVLLFRVGQGPTEDQLARMRRQVTQMKDETKAMPDGCQMTVQALIEKLKQEEPSQTGESGQ